MGSRENKVGADLRIAVVVDVKKTINVDHRNFYYFLVIFYNHNEANIKIKIVL